MKKVFISFSEKDKDKVSTLENRLKQSEYVDYTIVANKYGSSNLISKKVVTEIRTCQYFIPLITENSIRSQWVNQEIGYANCLKGRLKILPMVQTNIINELTGFIHKEFNPIFLFGRFKGAKLRERRDFKTCVNRLIHFIELQSGKTNDLQILFKGLWRNDYNLNELKGIDVFSITGNIWNDGGMPLFILSDIEFDDTGTEVRFTKSDMNRERKIRNILRIVNKTKIIGQEMNGAKVIYTQLTTPPLNEFYKSRVNSVMLPIEKRIEIILEYEVGTIEKIRGYIFGELVVNFLDQNMTNVKYYKFVEISKIEEYQKTYDTKHIFLLPSFIIKGYEIE